MSRVQRIERLIANTSRRLELAQHEVHKIKAELKELGEKLAEAKLEERQFQLPLALEPRTRGPSEKWAAVLNFMLLRSPNAVSLDELLHFATQNQLNISRSSARFSSCVSICSIGVCPWISSSRSFCSGMAVC